MSNEAFEMVAPRRILLASLTIVAACGAPAHDADNDSGVAPSRTDSAAVVADPDPAGAARARLGVIFDPLTLRTGDTVAGLVVTRAEVRRAAVDSTPVGVVAFRGALPLSGHRMAHFDSEGAGAPVCFEADSSSAMRMPRWAGDRRRPWFCFSNQVLARRVLGADSASATPLSLRIDDFTIHRGLSDEVNSARFVGLGRP